MDLNLDTLLERCSVRSFDGRILSPEHRTALESLLADEQRPGPFSHIPRFRLLDAARSGWTGTGERIGTYGVIRRAPAFIAGAVAPGEGSLVDYGYALEGAMVYAASLGLGTCWLGGTFKRSAAADHLGLADGEVLPAVTPVGYPADRRSLSDRAVRWIAESDGRKAWEELFFDGELSVPLTRAAAGRWEKALEALRRGPSASNKQPWRILREGEGRFVLLFAQDQSYNKALGMPIQELDLGIALRRFQEAARLLGLRGSWRALPGDPSDFQAGKWRPTARWE